MNTIIIQKPIWHDRSVGVDEAMMTTVFRVVIPYRKKDGNYIYPRAFYFSKDQAKHYPTQAIRGITLRLVPIKDMTIGEKVSVIEMEDARNGRFKEAE